MTATRPLPPDWPHRESSRRVRAGDLDWHVLVAGRGPTVLLLHGTGSSAHSWADLVPALAGSATVVAPDLPGHGHTTSTAPATLTLPRIAADLDAMLDVLRVPPIALVAGHSAGAALALRWALSTRHPPRAILGFNPSLVPPPALYTRLLAPVVTPIATSSVVTSGLAALAGRTRLVNGLLDSTRSAVPPAQRRRYTELFRDPAHLRGTMRFMAAADLAALQEDARALKVPATFVLGTLDAWIPERPLRRLIARTFPNATTLLWEGGHLLHEEHPERAARLIVELASPVVAPT